LATTQQILKNKTYRRLLMAAVATASLGLAPFFPEPHLLGKIKWLFGGAEGMAATDYFDLLLHAAPWVWLGYETYRVLKEPTKPSPL
jgi:hypothetical protein